MTNTLFHKIVLMPVEDQPWPDEVISEYEARTYFETQDTEPLTWPAISFEEEADRWALAHWTYNDLGISVEDMAEYYRRTCGHSDWF